MGCLAFFSEDFFCNCSNPWHCEELNGFGDKRKMLITEMKDMNNEVSKNKSEKQVLF